MLIDWFTVGAQTLNFLILVWLLKRYLYQPILDAIDSREKRIAAQLADAAAKEAAAEAARAQFQSKNAEFDEQRAALLARATHEAQAERGRLLDAARVAADALRAKQQDALEQERHDLSDEISRRTRDEVFAIARKALGDLAGATLDERIVDVFAARLRALAGDARDSLVTALQTASGPALLRSAFELAPAQRAALTQALTDSFPALAPVALRFETAPELIGGIELSANGQKLAWSIADYLGALEKCVGALLQDPPAAGVSR